MARNSVNNSEYEFFRCMMQAGKIEAPEDLKYRVMQQIEAEETLKRKAQKVHSPSTYNVLSNLIQNFGIMYILLTALTITAFIVKGKEFLFSYQFLGSCFLIIIIFVMLWLISQIDIRVESKQRRPRREP